MLKAAEASRNGTAPWRGRPGKGLNDVEVRNGTELKPLSFEFRLGASGSVDDSEAYSDVGI